MNIIFRLKNKVFDQKWLYFTYDKIILTILNTYGFFIIKHSIFENISFTSINL